MSVHKRLLMWVYCVQTLLYHIFALMDYFFANFLSWQIWDRVPGISSEIAGRNHAVSYRTSDYFPNVLTTPACPQTILQTADTPVPSHAQA